MHPFFANTLSAEIPRFFYFAQMPAPHHTIGHKLCNKLGDLLKTARLDLTYACHYTIINRQLIYKYKLLDEREIL